MSKSVLAFRVHFWGAPRVGKTTLLNRMATQSNVRKEEMPGYTAVTMDVRDRQVLLELYDHAPANRPHAVIAVVDDRDDATFDAISERLDNAVQAKTARVFLVVNRKEGRSSEERVYKKWARQVNIEPFEVSAQTGEGVRSMMVKVAEELFREYIRDQMHVCELTTEQLYKSPLAWLFRDPVDTSVYTDYRDVVKTPMDLNTIRKKLRRRMYSSVKEWQDDVNLIWKNCQSYNGHDYDVILDELQQIVKKNMREMPTTLKEIANQLVTTTSALTRTMEKPPREFEGLFPTETYTESDARLPFESRDIADLSRNIERLRTEGRSDDKQMLVQIARWFNLDTTNNEVDIAEMPDEAKLYFRSFVRERLSNK